MTKSKSNKDVQPQINLQPSKYHPDVAIKTPYNRHLFPDYHERNVLPSATIPDQTMSLKTLLERYARGLPLGVAKAGIYHGDEPLPDLRKLDLSEIHELKTRVSESIKSAQAEIAREQQLADEKKLEDKIQARAEQLKKSEEEQPPKPAKAKTNP